MVDNTQQNERMYDDIFHGIFCRRHYWKNVELEKSPKNWKNEMKKRRRKQPQQWECNLTIFFSDEFDVTTAIVAPTVVYYPHWFTIFSEIWFSFHYFSIHSSHWVYYFQELETLYDCSYLIHPIWFCC
jgi:hypothetical protein